MERHAQNAMAIAEFLEAHPLVEKVYYPGKNVHKQSVLINYMSIILKPTNYLNFFQKLILTIIIYDNQKRCKCVFQVCIKTHAEE